MAHDVTDSRGRKSSTTDGYSSWIKSRERANSSAKNSASSKARNLSDSYNDDSDDSVDLWAQKMEALRQADLRNGNDINTLFRADRPVFSMTGSTMILDSIGKNKNSSDITSKLHAGSQKYFDTIKELELAREGMSTAAYEKYLNTRFEKGEINEKMFYDAMKEHKEKTHKEVSGSNTTVREDDYDSPADYIYAVAQETAGIREEVSDIIENENVDDAREDIEEKYKKGEISEDYYNININKINNMENMKINELELAKAGMSEQNYEKYLNDLYEKGEISKSTFYLYATELARERYEDLTGREHERKEGSSEEDFLEIAGDVSKIKNELTHIIIQFDKSDGYSFSDESVDAILKLYNNGTINEETANIYACNIRNIEKRKIKDELDRRFNAGEISEVAYYRLMRQLLGIGGERPYVESKERGVTILTDEEITNDRATIVHFDWKEKESDKVWDIFYDNPNTANFNAVAIYTDGGESKIREMVEQAYNYIVQGVKNGEIHPDEIYLSGYSLAGTAVCDLYDKINGETVELPNGETTQINIKGMNFVSGTTKGKVTTERVQSYIDNGVDVGIYVSSSDNTKLTNNGKKIIEELEKLGYDNFRYEFIDKNHGPALLNTVYDKCDIGEEYAYEEPEGARDYAREYNKLEKNNERTKVGLAEAIETVANATYGAGYGFLGNDGKEITYEQYKEQCDKVDPETMGKKRQYAVVYIAELDLVVEQDMLVEFVEGQTYHVYCIASPERGMPTSIGRCTYDSGEGVSLYDHFALTNNLQKADTRQSTPENERVPLILDTNYYMFEITATNETGENAECITSVTMQFDTELAKRQRE